MNTMTLDDKAAKAGDIRATLSAGQPREALRLHNPVWAARLEDLHPNLRPGLARHILIGQPTGGFLTALLSNDLDDAVFRADPTSLAALSELTRFVRHCTPPLCHGSRAAVKAWRADGGLLSIEYDDADLEGGR